MKRYALAQVTLYYLLIKKDDHIDDQEMEMMQNIMISQFMSKSYVNSLVGILEKYQDHNSFELAINDLIQCDDEEKSIVLDNLEKLAMSDGQFSNEEIEFTNKVKKALQR